VAEEPVVDVEADKEAVMTVFNGLLEVSESGDAEGYLNFLTEDAVMMYPGLPAVEGTANIRHSVRGAGAEAISGIRCRVAISIDRSK
jgi:ketosteroid isomerase-like protein